MKFSTDEFEAIELLSELHQKLILDGEGLTGEEYDEYNNLRDALAHLLPIDR